MKNLKQINGQLIGIDKNGVVSKLNGNGVWVQLNCKELFKIIK